MKNCLTDEEIHSKLFQEVSYNNYFDRFKTIVGILLDEKSFLGDDLRYISMMSNNQFVMSSLVRDINMINHILGIKDSETLEHTNRVGDMSFYLSNLLGMDELFSEKIKIAAKLHDVGKLKIPDYLLLKTGKLTQEEYEIVKLHTTYGIEIIDKLSFIFTDSVLSDFIKNIVNYHHEKYDGTGYPLQIKGQEIPLEARIVTVIDIFDALKSKRPYKTPFDDTKVKEIMLEGRGVYFDPEILDMFLSHYYEFAGIRGINEDEYSGNNQK